MSDPIQTYKTIGAEVIKAPDLSYIRVLSIFDPEKIYINELYKYFKEVGFAVQYPNFRNIRIGAIHPFAIMLLREVTGEKSDVSLFPSITIANTDDQDTPVLGRDRTEYALSPPDIANIRGLRDAGEVFISDANLTAIEEFVSEGDSIVGVQARRYVKHTIDFNIWATNREITTLLYDCVQAFIVDQVEVLTKRGVGFEAIMDARRAGDVNLDFGSILYGANITITANSEHTSLMLDRPIGIIEEIDIYPDFFVQGDA